MDLYLTPGQFRALDLGVDVTGWIDSKLAAQLGRASADVNAYCQMPSMPAPHSFLGGVIVGETHTWRTDPFDTRPTRRIFPYHPPVQSIQSVRIYATTTQYLDLTAAELYYEPTEGWIEPASANLTSFGLFGSAMLPFIGLSDPVAHLNYTYGWLIPETVQLFYEGGGGFTWRATMSGHWTTDDIVVRVNGVVADDANYTINRTEGTITWTSANPNGTDTVEADVISKIPWDLSLATGIIAADRINQRNLVASGFPAGIQSLKVAEVSVERERTRFGRSAEAAQDESSIPDAAQELLGTYVRQPLSIV